MTGHRPRAALLAAAVPLAAAVTAAALRAARLELYVDRYRLELTPLPRPDCPDCHGEGGWWTGGPDPDMEACGCWTDRRGLRLPFLPRPAGWDEPPF
ncbi:hypothetical protein [Streptomyces kanasensis]|uniref:Uncharacterized protein n=1 Tax=Streptomyces kanasensis TaxID=936756 RepID=A0A124EC07_9ACTN|nr:hypothetical protein [Streptomyces kanasensis]KUH36111.1 hypothetical protein ATE80_25330 [Streptomyces kanasensis]